MAKQKGKGRPFQKGQTGNPNGSSRMAKIKAQLRGLTLEDVVRSGSVLLEDTDPKVCRRIIDSPDSNLATRLLATLADEALANRNVPAFNALFDRVFGKAKETVALGGDKEGVPLQFRDMTTEEKLAQIELRRRARQAAKAGK